MAEGAPAKSLKQVGLAGITDDLSRYFCLAEWEEIGPRFLARVEPARQHLRAGSGVRLEGLDGNPRR
jgi:hypothetical protein